MAPPPARPNAWTWVLLATTIVFLLAAGGLGFGYYSARSAVIDRNSQIEELQVDNAAKDDTIAEQDDQIDEAEQTLADAETELADAQACIDAMEAALTAPTEEEFNALFEEMLTICNF
jgi:septal ring factor EnvC (AmiA/AmiB activator)